MRVVAVLNMKTILAGLREGRRHLLLATVDAVPAGVAIRMPLLVVNGFWQRVISVSSLVIINARWNPVAEKNEVCAWRRDIVSFWGIRLRGWSVGFGSMRRVGGKRGPETEDAVAGLIDSLGVVMLLFCFPFQFG